jgi:hypothetical protein
MRQIRIDTWPEFQAFLNEPPHEETGAYYWRGQRDPSWPLAASWERKILDLLSGDNVGMGAADAQLVYPYGGRHLGGQAAPLAPGAYERMAKEHLERFKCSASGLRGPSPKELTEEQWWALGRHYGLVTPLLDWTEKPYIALFFALKGISNLGGEAVRRSRASAFAMYRLSHTAELQSDDLRVVKTPIDELGSMQQQRGLFTWIRSDRFFELQGLLDNTGRGDLLTMGVVSAKLIPDALHDLALHGIDHRLLFPDLYGAASHANSGLDLSPLVT